MSAVVQQMRMLNTQTQLIPVPRSGLIVPFRNDVPNDTFELDTHHFPADHFKGDGKTVQSFASATGYVAALRDRGEGLVGVYLYTDQGERVTKEIQGFPFLPYHLSGRSIIEKLRGTGNEGVRMYNLEGITTPSRLITFEALCTSLNVPAESQNELRQEIVERLGKGFNTPVVKYEEFLQLADTPLLPVFARLVSDPHRAHFTFVGDNSITIYSTQDEFGAPLQPQDWKRTVVLRSRALSEEKKKLFPWLESLLADSRIIPGFDSVRFSVDAMKGLQVFRIPTNEVVFQAHATHAIAEPTEGGGIYFALKNDPAVYRIPHAELKGLLSDSRQREVTAERVALPRPGFVTGLEFDPRGNFLLVRAALDEASADIMVLDQVNLKLSAMVQHVAPEGTLARAFEVDGKGNLVFIDRDGQLRLVSTTMGLVAHGALKTIVERRYEQHRVEQEQLRALEASIDAMTAPDLGKNGVRRITQADIQRQLASKLNEMFAPKIEAASSIDEIHKVRAQMDTLSEEPRYSNFKGAFDDILESLDRRQSSLEVVRLTQQIDKISALLNGAGGWPEMVEASKLFARLQGERTKSLIIEVKERNRIGEQIHALKERITTFRTERSGDLEGQIKEALERFEREIRLCQSTLEVQQHAGNETGHLLELISALSSPEIERTYATRIRNATNARKSELVMEQETHARRMREEQMDALRQLEALRESLKLELPGIASEMELQTTKKHSPLVKEYNNWAGRLPENLLVHELNKLDALFERRLHQITVPPPSTALGAGGGWEHLLPAFNPPQIVWSAELKPEPTEPGFGKLLFRDNYGRTFDPDHELLPLDQNSPKVQGAVEKYTSKAREYFEGVLSDIPAFSEEWVINNWTEGRLAEFGKLTKQQLRGDFGILVVRSEAGLGKNMLFDIFAFLTHRNLTTFSCNANTEIDDLTYLFQYDPKKRGTYKLNSHFIERCSIPGSIILLDEVNTLPPGVKKILNPLFDYRRTMFLPDGRKIIAHPSVIFVGLENFKSASYQAVHAHSADFTSRARVLELDYPPFKEKGSTDFLPYEAELYAKQLETFRGMSSPDFAKLWDKVINQQGLSGILAGLESPERVSDIKDVHKIVNIANKIRVHHRQKTEGGEAGFVFTPREGRQIMAEVKDGASLHDAVYAVILPKIQEAEIRAEVKVIIDGVIPNPNAP